MMNEKSSFLFQLALRSPKIGQAGIPVLSGTNRLPLPVPSPILKMIFLPA